MKKTIFLLAIVVFVVMCKQSTAQTYMELHKTDASVESYLIEEIRKITFDTLSGTMRVMEWDGGIMEYQLTDIRKITFMSTLTTQTQTVTTFNDTLHFDSTGIVMVFDSTLTTLPSNAYVKVTHHKFRVGATPIVDSVATVFNNFFWDITSNIESFKTRICFNYDTTQLNTSFIDNLSLVFQEQAGNPWSLIDSKPTVTDSQICFYTNHWSNWAIAITKPEPKIKRDTSFNNSGVSKLTINKTFEEGLTLYFDLMPGEFDSTRYTKYDINPGGNLPSGVQKFTNGFWELKGNIDTVALYFDLTNINGYQTQDKGKYYILYRPDAFTDWAELPTYRVKKGLKEKLYIRQETSSTGDYILGLKTSVLPIFSVTAQVDTGCAGDTIRLTSTLSGGTAPYSIHWLGDNNLDEYSSNITHIYPSMGQYNYILSVKDSTGAIADYPGLINIDCITGKSLEFKVSGLEFQAFPNPINENDLTIVYKNENEGKIKITLFDIYGRKVYQKSLSTHQQINPSTYQLILPPLSSGLYLLQCETEGRLWIQRVVKQ